MASERFGTGFFFARHLSTAAIISSLKPMIFLTGCVSGRPIISHMPNRLPHISHISNRQARGSVYFRPGSWPRLPEKTTTTTKMGTCARSDSQTRRHRQPSGGLRRRGRHPRTDRRPQLLRSVFSRSLTFPRAGVFPGPGMGFQIGRRRRPSMSARSEANQSCY